MEILPNVWVWGKSAWPRGIKAEAAVRNSRTMISNQPGITCHLPVLQNIARE